MKEPSLLSTVPSIAACTGTRIVLCEIFSLYLAAIGVCVSMDYALFKSRSVRAFYHGPGPWPTGKVSRPGPSQLEVRTRGEFFFQMVRPSSWYVTHAFRGSG